MMSDADSVPNWEEDEQERRRTRLAAEVAAKFQDLSPGKSRSLWNIEGRRLASGAYRVRTRFNVYEIANFAELSRRFVTTRVEELDRMKREYEIKLLNARWERGVYFGSLPLDGIELWAARQLDKPVNQLEDLS